MFGMPAVNFFNRRDTGNLGPQVRGFGFTNEGSVDTIFTFFNALVFNPTLNSGIPLVNPDATRRDVEQYVLAFDSDLAPIVGQQVTLGSVNLNTAAARVTLLEQRAGAPFTSLALGGQVTECDLVASVVANRTVMSFLYAPASQVFTAAGGSSLTDAALRAMAAIPGKEVTFTCLPPGSGTRVVSSQ
jgi:hypothetical protein